MWPCRRADHGAAVASGPDSGCWHLNTSSCVANSSAASSTWPSTAEAPFLRQPGLPSSGSPQGLFRIRTHLGNCDASTMSSLSSLRLSPHTLSRLDSICQSIDKLLHLSPDDVLTTRVILGNTSELVRTEGHLTTTWWIAASYEKQWALGPVIYFIKVMCHWEMLPAASVTQGRVWAVWHGPSDSKRHRAMSTE